MINNYIPVVFCFDEKFASYAAVATYSAFLNSITPIKFYWVIPIKALSEVTSVKEKLPNADINIVIITVDDSPFESWKEMHHIKRASYLRLLIPDTVMENKAIYLDCDIIVQSDLSLLFSTNLGDNLIAGAADLDGGALSEVPFSKSDNYINCGVLVMNLDGLRKDMFFSKCRAVYEMFSEEVTWCDQCVINKYAENKKAVFHSKWNIYVWYIMNHLPLETEKLLHPKNASILHFGARIKPWHRSCRPQIADAWWKYANMLSGLGLKREPYKKERRSLIRRINDSMRKRIAKIKGVWRFLKKI